MRSVTFWGKFTSGSRISASRSDLLELTGAFVFTGAIGATVVVMSETAIRFFSALGFHNFVWILHWRVVVVLPRRRHRNRQGIVRFGGL